MRTNPSARLITLPNNERQALSVRAKAMIFEDPASLDLLSRLERISPTEANVLLIGETGTGKELIARHIHACSGRDGPFLAVNCGAFSENLIEAELFGHESGAYTGAQQARAGWFEAAHGGTLFLDEIGDLPLTMQVKLLRVLQERTVTRLGSRKPTLVDVRLVTATNVNLEKAVIAGRFRLDLYYRLNVASLTLPPLRERRGDILPLVTYFIDYYAGRLKITPPALTSEASQRLRQYPWPGNIRELENVVHFALIIAQDGHIRPADLRLPGIFQIDGPAETRSDGNPPGQTCEDLRANIKTLLHDGHPDLYAFLEQVIVTTAFEFCLENQARTARELGISRNILRALLKRHGLISECFQPS